MNQSAALPVFDRSSAPATAPTHPRLRAVGALVSGLFTIVALSHGTDAVLRGAGLFPEQGQPMSDTLFLLAASYRTLYGVLGCYLSARLAPQRPQAFALGLGCFGFIVSLIGALATWNAGPECGPRWYALALAATAIPAGWLGARLLLWQQRRGGR